LRRQAERVPYSFEKKGNETVRVKTDAKRQEIVATAWKVFREKGFDGASMSDVAERLGGSKATLYRYYKSKEELFAAALEQMIGESGRQTFAGLWDEGDLKPRLLEFALTYMANRMRADTIAIERALIAEGDRSDLGERLRRQFVEPYWRRLAAVFNHEMRAARLRTGDPLVATWHFRGLIEADLVERRLHGDSTITAAEIKRAATEGVEVFLRAYAL
jgi:AcrR family transcriptional regulator